MLSTSPIAIIENVTFVGAAPILEIAPSARGTVVLRDCTLERTPDGRLIVR